MIDKLMALFLRLPIVRLLQHHHAVQCEAECDRQELLRQQHDVARRVHVLEWMTYPHTDKKKSHHD